MILSPRILSAAVVLSFAFLLNLPALAGQTPAGSPQDVLTHHGDSQRTGWFSAETTLTASNVNANSFGLIKTVALDGRVDAEPLYVSQQTIVNKGVHNVLYVATENNSVYAIDAGSGAILWHKKFGPAVPYQYKNFDDNVFPIIGILSTAVIDRNLGNLYFVADTYNGTVDSFHLHAISLSSGNDAIQPTTIKISARLADGTIWIFNPKFHLQRPGLLEANNAIYVAFGSNGDLNPHQSRGSIVRYDATTLLPMASDVTNTLAAPTSSFYLSSIWQSGYGLAADANGDVYFSTGNSNPSVPSYSASFNRPDSIIHLSGDLNSLVDSFTPSNYFSLDKADVDLGSAGMILLPDQPGSIPHLAVAGSEDGRAFLLNRDNLGGYNQGGPDHVLQTITQGRCWCGPAYFVAPDGSTHVLTGGSNGVENWRLQTSPEVKLVRLNSTGSGPADGLPDSGGTIPVISSNGSNAGTGVVWFIQKPKTSSDSDPGTPMKLMAYDASNLSKQLFSAAAGTWTHAVNSNANVVPTVANGRVYVASNKQVQIFGLLSPNGSAARASLPRAMIASQPDVVACLAAGSPLAAIRGPRVGVHQFYGTVCRATSNEVQLSLRGGRSIVFDVSHELMPHQHVVLTPGRPIGVSARIDKNGKAHALRIFHAHTFSPLTPADR